MTDDKPEPATDAPSLLAAFHGARPPAPAWFHRAIAHVPERSTIVVDGASIELLAWGKVGAPGLLLLHGGMAHADWWSFIAPYFAETHRVAALSWSGMGASSWRKSYHMDQFVTELRAAMQAAGFDKATQKPFVLGHSFGGAITMRLAHTHGREFAGAIVLDAPIETPAVLARRAARNKAEKPPRDTRIYTSEAEALGRFRFSPPQPCDHPYLVDWIARNSLRPINATDGSQGVTWKFDPFLWSRLKRTDATTDLVGAQCRVAMLWGGTSSLFPKDTIDFIREKAPRGTLFAEIPDAGHHVMVDQPHALVAITRAIMSAWA